MLEKIQHAVEAGLISTPKIQKLPDSTPFHAAVCALALPAGCLPPVSGAPRRVASGCSFTIREARFLAMAEAVERYSLQYSINRSRSLVPVMTIGGDAESCCVNELTIGAPGSNGKVDSKGCATGIDLEDASLRAALEALEHNVLQDIEAGKISPRVLLDAAPSVSTVSSWLKTQLRSLRHIVFRSASGVIVVKSCCSDWDGGRPTYGSSASFDFDRALVSSTLEAVFHWRNMVEIERRGTAVNPEAKQESRALKEYRGAVTQRFSLDYDELTLQEIGLRPKHASRGNRVSLELALSELLSMWGNRVRLFDLSSEEIGIPVVRVLMD